MLTVAQAAERMGVSPSLVYELCREGRIVHFRLGREGKRGCIRIREEEIQAFIEACSRGPPEPAIPLKHIRLGHG